jgi:TATA-binding protein-associated factor Taf7
MESLNQETERVELEDQFILRLPPVTNNENDKAMSLNILFSQQKDADYVRCLLASKPKKIKKKLRLDIDAESGEGVVMICDKSLKCRLRKMPTMIESLKTYNKSLFVKTADICQILDCVNTESGPECIHGLSTPLKNVKKKRFRRCLINRDEASVNVQKELFYLLQADIEAVSYNTLFFFWFSSFINCISLFPISIKCRRDVNMK